MIHHRTIVKYSIVYQKHYDFSEKDLTAFEKTTLIKVLVHLNHLAHNRKDYLLNQVIEEWFNKENIEYAKTIYLKIILAYQAEGINMQSLGFINIWTNLTLLDDALRTDWTNTKPLQLKEAEEKLFDIYLSTNERYAEGSNKLAIELADYTDIFEYHARSLVASLISYHDLQHVTPVSVFISNYIKSYYLFSFLEKEGHLELLEAFLAKYGAKDWKEYLDLILPLAAAPIKSADDSGLYYFNVMEGVEKERREKFLARMTSTEDISYATIPDFVNARSRPLFLTEDGRYLVIDNILMSNRIYNSMFFDLLAIAPKLKSLAPKYKEFFSFFTYEFIEKYLAYKLLNQAFEKSQSYKLTGKEIMEKFNVRTEPDYYLRKGNKVFLFEVKGSMLTGKAKQSFSFSFIEEELKKKFYFDVESHEKKAILQLVERIKIMMMGNASYDPSLNLKRFRVYPILLTTEFAMTTPGMNYILNQWFRKAIDDIPELKTHNARIHDLVILDFDTLIHYQDNFSDNKGLFEKTILDYYNYTKKNKINPGTTVEETKQKAMKTVHQRMESYPMFIKRTVPSSTPRLFMEFGRSLLHTDVNKKNNQ